MPTVLSSDSLLTETSYHLAPSNKWVENSKRIVGTVPFKPLLVTEKRLDNALSFPNSEGRTPISLRC